MYMGVLTLEETFSYSEIFISIFDSISQKPREDFKKEKKLFFSELALLVDAELPRMICTKVLVKITQNK